MVVLCLLVCRSLLSVIIPSLSHGRGPTKPIFTSSYSPSKHTIMSNVTTARSSTRRSASQANSSEDDDGKRACRRGHHQCCECKEYSWENSDTSTGDTFFQLPCPHKHCLCPRCFSSTIASKGPSYFYFCPGCNNDDDDDDNCKPLNKWTVFFHDATSRRRKNETHKLAEPDRNINPVLYHHKQQKEQPGAKHQAQLSISTTDPSNNESTSVFAISSTIETDKVDRMNREERKSLQTIFQLLHPILVQPSRQDFCVAFDNKSRPETLNISTTSSLYDIAIHDKTVLFACIYALTTGYPLPSLEEHLNDNDEHGQAGENKKYISLTFAVCEMIRNAKWRPTKKHGPRSILKEYVGNQLMVNNANNALYHFFNQIGISNSVKTIRKDCVRVFQEKLEEGYCFDGKKYDLFLILFDNLGFKVRGRAGRVGYDQYTPLQIINVKKQDMIRWGVYPDRESGREGEFQFFFLFEPNLFSILLNQFNLF